MQQCGDCGRVYDESEYSGCPYCDKSQYSFGKGRMKPYTPDLYVTDKETGKLRRATDEEYEYYEGKKR